VTPATRVETSPPGEEAGLTGLQELAVAISIAALLSVSGMFTYRILLSGAGDRSAQATIGTALAAAHDVYVDTQDYGLIGSAQPTGGAGGACSTAAAGFSLLTSYAAGVDVRCGALTTPRPGSVVLTAGELTDGDAGGWIGLAATAADGRCWQVYQPADGPPVYGSSGGGTCEAPASPPTGGGTSW
jgi:hypothetical protein